MFNDKYGLTKAVLEGRKTQTRRAFAFNQKMLTDDLQYAIHYSYYKVGEIAAIAQRYNDLGFAKDSEFMKHNPAWVNKMFVKAELMPHHIKIERIRIERLQDISNEDCLAEGICFHENPPKEHCYDPYTPWPLDAKPYKHDIDNSVFFFTARDAYAYLVDKISGRGTWFDNPLVFVYDFKLID